MYSPEDTTGVAIVVFGVAFLESSTVNNSVIETKYTDHTLPTRGCYRCSSSGCLGDSSLDGIIYSEPR